MAFVGSPASDFSSLAPRERGEVGAPLRAG